MKNNGYGKMIILSIIFFVAIIFLADSLLLGNTKQEEIEYSQVVQKFQKEEIKRYYVDNTGKLYLSANEAESEKLDLNSFEFVHKLADIEQFRADLGELIIAQTQGEILKEYDYEAPEQITWWSAFLPYLIVIIILVVIFWLFIARTSKNGSGGGMGLGKMNSFSKARTKLGSDEKVKVLFSDVAGADEEKEELQEVVEFLRNPEKFSDLGARIPKGVLLVGSPGTGKTLLAKAVAGESGVPFYSISGSDFVEMYVGVGASRVRDLFDPAKKNPAAIIFNPSAICIYALHIFFYLLSSFTFRIAPVVSWVLRKRQEYSP